MARGKGQRDHRIEVGQSVHLQCYLRQKGFKPSTGCNKRSTWNPWMKLLTKDPRAVYLRSFVCQSCGTTQTFTKRKHKTIPGHEKDAYCYKCQRKTKWLQID